MRKRRKEVWGMREKEYFDKDAGKHQGDFKLWFLYSVQGHGTIGQ
jgi:hypothetical protein